jgi:hypothetical protein
VPARRARNRRLVEILDVPYTFDGQIALALRILKAAIETHMPRRPFLRFALERLAVAFWHDPVWPHARRRRRAHQS